MTGHGLLLSHSGFVSIYDIKKIISSKIIESLKGHVRAPVPIHVYFFYFFGSSVACCSLSLVSLMRNL